MLIHTGIKVKLATFDFVKFDEVNWVEHVQLLATQSIWHNTGDKIKVDTIVDATLADNFKF